MKRIVFIASDTCEQMIEDLRVRMGHNTITSIIVDCISQVHRKNFPAYKNVASQSAIDHTPEEVGRRKAQVQISKKEEEENIKISQKRKICLDVLYGEVTLEDGEFVCKYTNYQPKNDWPQKLPLMSVTKDLANNLFIPSKALVLKKRPELKSKFGDK
jgi:hypothetical protein